MGIEKIPVPGEIKKDIKKKDKADDLLAEARVWEKEQKESSTKNQILDLVENAGTVLKSKELEPKDKTNLLDDYSKQIAKLANKPITSIYLTELIKNDKKLKQLLNNIPEAPKQSNRGEQEKVKTEKEPDITKKQFQKILEDYKNGKGITPESFFAFMATPGAGNFLAKTTENPAFQKAFKQPENEKKIQETIDKFQKFVKQNQEKEKSTPEAVKKVKKFIEKTNDKEKKSIWGTTGELMEVSVFLLFVVFAMLEFKGIEKLIGIDLGAGKKKK